MDALHADRDAAWVQGAVPLVLELDTQASKQRLRSRKDRHALPCIVNVYGTCCECIGAVFLREAWVFRSDGT
jgi:hypothetical protein